MRISYIYYICLFCSFTAFLPHSLAGNPALLMRDCNSELEYSIFNGSCLRLGIIAKKIKHQDLFEKIQSICVKHFQTGKTRSDELLKPLIKYYPQCLYVFEGTKIDPSLSEILNAQDDLKTLVRFLNNTNVQ